MPQRGFEARETPTICVVECPHAHDLDGGDDPGLCGLPALCRFDGRRDGGWSGASRSRECQDFSAPVTAAGTPEQASGQACQQPDGSWRVVQNTPGLPAQEYLVPRRASTQPQAPAVRSRCSRRSPPDATAVQHAIPLR